MSKLAVGGVIGGLMLAVAIGSALHSPAPAVEPTTALAVVPDAATVVPSRCRIITMPDSGCDAAWDARRRHFFGGGHAR